MFAYGDSRCDKYLSIFDRFSSLSASVKSYVSNNYVTAEKKYLKYENKRFTTAKRYANVLSTSGSSRIKSVKLRSQI